jgi:hypothetical protein
MHNVLTVRKVLWKFTLFALNHLLSSLKPPNTPLKFSFPSFCFVLQVSADLKSQGRLEKVSDFYI